MPLSVRIAGREELGLPSGPPTVASLGRQLETERDLVSSAGDRIGEALGQSECVIVGRSAEILTSETLMTLLTLRDTRKKS